MSRGQVWVGDWLRAWAHRTTDETGGSTAASALIQMLQLEITEAAVPTPEPGDGIVELTGNALGQAGTIESSVAVSHHVPKILGDHGMSRATDDVHIQPIARRPATSVPQPLSEPLAPSAERLPEHELEPLFKAATERALIGAVVATWRPEGAIAIRTLIESLARRKPPARVPRRVVPTTRMGATLVIERAVLDALSDDVIALRRQLQRVVGASSIAEWWLEPYGDPKPRGRHHPRWPPPPTSPVIAVVMSTASLDHLAHRLAEQRCPIVAIVPGHLAPSSAKVTAVPWDHRTTVAAVARARRTAARP